LQIEYHPIYQLWLGLPVIGAVIVGLTGYWGVRSVVKQPPLVVLRKA
jgi:putative ABC transport system permease protein